MTLKSIRHGLVALLAATGGAAHAAPLTGSACPPPCQDGAFAETRLAVAKRGGLLALRDLTGDGKIELLSVTPAGILAQALDAEGKYAAAGALLAWPAGGTGWDLADLDGDGRVEVLMVSDGKTLVRRSFTAAGAWSEPETVLETGMYLPAATVRVPFTRDLDEDGLLDLVLPGPGRFHMRLNRGLDGAGKLGWSDPIEVEYEPEINYRTGDPDRLSSTFSQRVRVPWFSMDDIDGDGQLDLVSETSERVAFHLAKPEIDARPTWSLDLSELRSAPSASDLDLDNLLGAVSGLAQWRAVDLDGEGPRDLIVSSEGTFKVYRGATLAGPSGAPDQVLKASGNVLYFFVRDVLGDSAPDLQIVRGERISLAQLVKFLVVPGKLDFDVFTYENKGGTFDRRPTRRTTLALRIPRIFKLMNEFEEVSEQLEAQWDIPARRIDWDGDGEANDIVDVVDDQLMVFANCAPAQQRFEDLSVEDGVDGIIEKVVLNDLDRLGDGEESVIDLGELDRFAVAPGKGLRDATAGETPVLRFPTWPGKDDRGVRARDLDGDGRLDLITVVDGPEGLQVQFLVRR